MHLFPQIEILHHRRTFVNGWVVFLSLIQKNAPQGTRNWHPPPQPPEACSKKRLAEWYHENLLSPPLRRSRSSPYQSPLHQSVIIYQLFTHAISLTFWPYCGRACFSRIILIELLYNNSEYADCNMILRRTLWTCEST